MVGQQDFPINPSEGQMVVHIYTVVAALITVNISIKIRTAGSFHPTAGYERAGIVSCRKIRRPLKN